MANEITANAQLTILKNGFSISGNNTQRISISGSQYLGNIQSIGSGSYESVVTGDLSQIRYLFLLNQSTASIQVSMNSTSQSFSLLRPNDILLLPPSASVEGSSSFMNYQLKSDQANADLQVVMVEY